MLLPVLRELGAEPSGLFEALATRPDDLTPDGRISFADGLVILQRAVALSGLPHLGLRVGAANDERCLGPVGELMRCAPTLGVALSDYIGVQGGISQVASAYLHPFRDGFMLGYGIYARHAAGVDQAYDLALAAGAAIVRSITGGAVQPVEMLFSHRAPTDRRAYERILRCPVRFDEGQSCIVLPKGCLDVPLPHADPVRRGERVRALRVALALERRPSAAQLRHVLRPLLSTGSLSLVAAARSLAISQRTLNRKLRAEGTSFAQERDAVRFTMAKELLATTDMPAGQVALALSYATPSVFVRAFRRWSGMTPTAWRAQAMAA
jgi:AraC-like DNA-binding protein